MDQYTSRGGQGDASSSKAFPFLRQFN